MLAFIGSVIINILLFSLVCLVFIYPYYVLKEVVRRYLYECRGIECFTHEEKVHRGYLPDEEVTIFDTVAVEVTRTYDGTGEVTVEAEYRKT